MALLLTDIRLTLAADIWWYVLAAVVAIAAAYVVYRYTLPPVSRFRKTILWMLRGAALAILILLLFEPVLAYWLRTKKMPVIACLIDQSLSMQAASSNHRLRASLRDIMISPTLRDLADHADLRCYRFSDTLIEIPPDSVSDIGFTGIGSNLAGAWVNAEKILAGTHLSAVILISDGIYNLGENPARAAASSSVPIYALGVGDTSAMADAVITEILTNEIAYKGSRIPVDVRVRGTGLKSQTTRLRIIGQNGVELGRQEIHFNDDESEVTASFSYEAESAGDFRLTAILDSVSLESLLDNNRRSVIVRVLDRRTSVYLFAGAPSADLTIIRQVLEEDTTLEIAPFIENEDGAFLYDRRLPSTNELAKTRLIVLVDFPSRFSPQTFLQSLSDIIQQARIPVFFFTGPDVQASKLESLEEVLPFKQLKPLPAGQTMITRAGEMHPVISGAVPLPVDWSELPPVLGSVSNYSVNPSAVILTKLSRMELGLNEDEPGIVLWELASRRGVAFLCWRTSNWQLQMANSPAGSQFFRQVIARLRMWLTSPMDERQVRIQTTKRLYSGREAVRFIGEIYGTDLTPRNDAVVSVQAASAERSETVTLRNRGSGRYEGEFTPWSEGDYRFFGYAIVGEDTLGKDQGMFAVEAFNMELLDTRARFDILRQIGAASGGGFAPFDKADSLLRNLKPAPREVDEQREAALWNRGILIWLIIGLLSFEWIIRKRSGML